MKVIENTQLIFWKGWRKLVMMVFLFVFYFYFKQHWMLTRNLNVSYCSLFIDGFEGRWEGRVQLGFGRILKSFPAIVGLVQEPWEHLLARQDFIPCFSSQPIAALFHFARFKNQKGILPLPKGTFCLNPSMTHAMARLETSQCSSCPAALAFFGVLPPSLRDRPSSYPQFTCCHFFFHYVWPLLITELKNWSCSMLAAVQWNLQL